MNSFGVDPQLHDHNQNDALTPLNIIVLLILTMETTFHALSMDRHRTPSFEAHHCSTSTWRGHALLKKKKLCDYFVQKLQRRLEFHQCIKFYRINSIIILSKS